MKKIKLTEEQYKLYEQSLAEQKLLENIEKTKGGIAVRKLIKEGDTIKGEYKTVYGSWISSEWDNTGEALKTNNLFERHIYSLDMEEMNSQNIDIERMKEISFPPELQEGPTQNVETYYDTFSGAVQAARANVEARGFTIDEDDWNRDITFGQGKPSVGQNTRAIIGLFKDGKPQRKAMNISVYGMDSGKYELTFYVN